MSVPEIQAKLIKATMGIMASRVEAMSTTHRISAALKEVESVDTRQSNVESLHAAMLQLITAGELIEDAMTQLTNAHENVLRYKNALG